MLQQNPERFILLVPTSSPGWSRTKGRKTVVVVVVVPVVLSVSGWRFGDSVVGGSNEVARHRTRLVLGWVSVFDGQSTSVFNASPGVNSALHPSWVAKSSTTAASAGGKGGNVTSAGWRLACNTV